MLRTLIAVVVLFILSITASAESYTYQARIEGMVCAFCAYNVGKTIGALSGVDADSVFVDLESELVAFRTTSFVDSNTVSDAFSDFGFTLVKLEKVALPARESVVIDDSPLAVFHFDAVSVSRFEPVLEAVGDTAAAQHLRLIIRAPETAEIEILTPILMGRNQAISVRFVPMDMHSIHLEMFSGYR